MPVTKIQTGLRLDETTYEKAKAICAAERRSLNNLVEYALQQYIDRYEQVNGPVQLPSAE